MKNPLKQMETEGLMIQNRLYLARTEERRQMTAQDMNNIT